MLAAHPTMGGYNSMDRRTLFFVCALSATLFLVNALFTYMDRDKILLIEQQQQAKKDQKLKNFSEVIESKTAPARAFNLVDLYVGGEELPSARGVRVDDVVVSFAWHTPAPKSIVALLKENGKDVEKTLQLINSPLQKGDLLLYAEKNDQKLLHYEIAPLGSYEMQMLVFGEHGTVTPVYAELKDGDLTVPLKALAKGQNHADYPEGNALVFTKVEDRYLPVGVYINKEDSLIPLASLPSVDDHLQFFSHATAEHHEGEEKFYLIETPYQQLLFSNRGAAIVEINLPFESKEHPASVVREIEADRSMVKNDPQNAMFPAKAYYTPAEPEKSHTGKLGGYYPLLRRDLITKQPKNNVLVPPTYYAFNTISTYPEVAEQLFTVSHFDNKSITFESKQPHRRITKTYTLPQDAESAPYCLDLLVKIDGDSRGLWLTSGVPDVEWISGSPAPALKFRITRDGKPDVESLSLPNEAFTTTTTSPDWVCTTNGFFGIILDPLTVIPAGYRALKVPGQALPSRLVELNLRGQDTYDPNKMPGYAMMLPITGGTSHFRIYSGPLAEGILKKVDATFSDAATNYNPDYLAAISFHGWFSFISAPFTKVLLFLMEIFYSITGSWAFSIVLLTIALRLMLYPLNSWSMKAMARTQEIAPLVQKIQQKHKNDKQKMQLEIATLYREKKINPLSGCVPMLIQIPFLISMFDLLKSTFALRGASFIPGWIDNLSAPDVLFDWGFPIIFIGSEFHLLPILLGGVMFLQTRLTAKPPANTEEITEAQRQQKAMGMMMPVLFTFMFYNFPSGLNIYWLSSTLMGMGQQWIMNKKLENAKKLEVEKKVKTDIKRVK